jgi:hypothetical protein
MSEQPGVDVGPDTEFDGIQWPEVFEFGEIATAILPCDIDDEDALLDAGMLMSAVLVSDPPTIVYSYKLDPRRRDNDICHELGHMIATDVFGHQYEMDDSHAQGLGNFLHTLIRQVLQAHGVEVYEPAMETKRTTSLCEIASRGWRLAEALAACDGDGEGRSLGSAGRGHPRGRLDEESYR